MVGVWNATTGVLLFKYVLPFAVGWVGFSSDGTRIVTLATDLSEKADPLLQIWDARLDARSPTALADYVRCRVPLTLEGERPVPAKRVCR